MRKKLQTYQGVIAYKADKTPVKRVFYGRSKAEAKAKYFAYIAEHGQAEKCSDLYTVSGWAAQWLLLYKRPYITDPAYSTTYELPIRRHILPALGHMLLVDVTPADILRFYQQASSLSPSMCGKIRMCVNVIFRSACSNGLCTSNPADGCKLESMALPQIKEVYNDRKIEIASRWFLSRMPEVVLLLETGMRRGELVGLHPEDIDRRRRLYRCLLYTSDDLSGSLRQVSAKLRWRKNGAPAYTEYAINTATQGYTIPAGVLPAGDIDCLLYTSQLHGDPPLGADPVPETHSAQNQRAGGRPGRRPPHVRLPHCGHRGRVRQQAGGHLHA